MTDGKIHRSSHLALLNVILYLSLQVLKGLVYLWGLKIMHRGAILFFGIFFKGPLSSGNLRGRLVLF